MVTHTTNCVTGEAAFAVDRNGVIVLWNPAAEKELGYPASTALGQRCWKLLCGKDTYGNPYCSEHCPIREIAFQHKSVNSYSASFKTASAGRKQYAISCVVVPDKTGNGLLLHMFHPVAGTLDNSNNHATTKPSISNYRGTLTQRELTVLTLLADGKSTHEIASRLFISIPTVRNHIQHILNKLHVHNRLEAVMLGKSFELI